MARNNYVLIVLDSCRYDTFTKASPKNVRKLGRVERRRAYASWAAPSHYNLLMGLMPHSSPRGVFAFDYCRRDFLKFNERFGAQGLDFFQHLDDHVVGGKLRRRQGKPFNDTALKELRNRQIKAVGYLDGVIGHLFDSLPRNTYVTITSDHGELFGEVGHGPIQHPKVLEVPFVEGKLR